MKKKKYKIYVEAPVRFTYNYELAEEDLCGGSFRPNLDDEADNLYHHWRDEVAALIRKNIKVTVVKEGK